MRPEDLLAMTVVLKLADDPVGFANFPAACERIRQLVANEARTMRQEVEKKARKPAEKARSDALDEVHALVTLKLGFRDRRNPSWGEVADLLEAIVDLAAES